jgi:hypothetical protein
MSRISPALMIQVAETFAWLLVGVMACPGVAQEDSRPTAVAPSAPDLVPPAEVVQPTEAVPPYYAGGSSAVARGVVMSPFCTIIGNRGPCPRDDRGAVARNFVRDQPERR